MQIANSVILEKLYGEVKPKLLCYIICTGHVLQQAKLLEDRTVRLKKMDVTSSIRMQNSDTRMLTNS